MERIDWTLMGNCVNVVNAPLRRLRAWARVGFCATIQTELRSHHLRASSDDSAQWPLRSAAHGPLPCGANPIALLHESTAEQREGIAKMRIRNARKNKLEIRPTSSGCCHHFHFRAVCLAKSAKQLASHNGCSSPSRRFSHRLLSQVSPNWYISSICDALSWFRLQLLINWLNPREVGHSISVTEGGLVRSLDCNFVNACCWHGTNFSIPPKVHRRVEKAWFFRTFRLSLSRPPPGTPSQIPLS